MSWDFPFHSDSQSEWFTRASAFAEAHLAEDPGPRERDGIFCREGYVRCAELGVAGLPVPTEYGGQGQGLLETVAAMEGLGATCPDNGLLFALGASLWTITMPILEFGTESQKQRWLPGLCDGRLLGANAASEPEAGSDIFSMTTHATRHDAGWILNGRKIWITGGPVADVYVVFATTAPDKGAMGVSAFIVPAGTPGFSVVRTVDKMGLRTAPMGELVFEDCALPDEALLGREGRGSRIFNAALEWERGAILAPTLGAMRRQVDVCIRHARKRKQFGQAVGKFQAVSNRIAEMRLRVETCRLLVHKFAWKKDRGEDAGLEASMIKWHVSECFVQNSLDTIRTLGAIGYTTEFPHERDLRDSVGGVLFSGTNDIQKLLVAQRLRI